MAVRETKHCRKCDQVKPFAEFPKNRRECRVCMKARQRRWEAENREHVNAQSRAWTAENPELSKEIKRRSYESRGAKALARARYAENPEKYRMIARARNLADPESARQRAKKYREANPEKCAAIRKTAMLAKPEKYRAIKYHGVLRRRARRRGLPDSWTRAQASRAIDCFDNSCAVCQTPFGLIAKPHFDHWIPLTHPACPGTIPGNMLPMCQHCNLSKNNHDAGEWLRERFDKKTADMILHRVAVYFSSVFQPTTIERIPT